ncbi:tripartite tricarboxylate transporter substrate binding protein [Acetobacteraceae bacterium H6797]|nr:tripartite tricarboxylate transporter substrate binding protein [Acetobacteraceae bacterium H6797]
MSLSRRRFGAGALAAPFLLPAMARAQSGFPARPVSLIVPFPAGGTTDVTMRALAEATAKRLGQAVIIENRPGAGSTLGAAAVARARPDGYTLTQLPASAVRMQLLQKLPFDTLRDLTPIVHVTGYTFGAITRKDRFPGGWKEFVAEAKRRPGALSIGNTGANGTPHVAMAELALAEGIEVNHIAFKGDADGSQAVLGGHIDAMAGGSGIGSLVDGGQARWLHVWTAQRLRRWPDAPTLVELGHPDMVITSPYGIVGPAGMEPGVVIALHDAFAAGLRDPQHLQALEKYDMAPDYKNSEDYATFLRNMVAREKATIQRLGLSAG